MSEIDFLEKTEDYYNVLAATVKKNDIENKEKANLILDLENKKKKLEADHKALSAQLKRRDEVMKAANEKLTEFLKSFDQSKINFEKLVLKNAVCTHLSSLRRREKFKENQIVVLQSLIDSYKDDADYVAQAFDEKKVWIIYKLVGKDPMEIVDARQELIMMEERIKMTRHLATEKVNNLSKWKESLEAYEVEEAKCRGLIRTEGNKVVDEEEYEKVEEEIALEEEILENLKAEYDFALTDLDNMGLVFIHYSDELGSLPVLDNTIVAAEDKLKRLLMDKDIVPKLANEEERLKHHLTEMKRKTDATISSYEQKLDEQRTMQQNYTYYMEIFGKAWSRYGRKMDEIRKYLVAKAERECEAKEIKDIKLSSEELVKCVVKLKVDDQMEELKENKNITAEEKIKEISIEKCPKETEDNMIVDTKGEETEADLKNEKAEIEHKMETDEVVAMETENDLNIETIDVEFQPIKLEVQSQVENSSDDLLKDPESEDNTKKRMCSIQ